MNRVRNDSVRERMRVYIMVALGCFQLSCSNDTGSTESEARGGAPSSSTLCKLVPGETTLEEAKELLGKPAAQGGSMKDVAAVLSYSYGTQSLSLTFADGVLWMTPTVVGIEAPDCWSDD
jgi:hypothetical protein